MGEKPYNPSLFVGEMSGSEITLRDIFAGMALMGMNASPELMEVVTATSIINGSAFELMAEKAYQQAECMLRARDS